MNRLLSRIIVPLLGLALLLILSFFLAPQAAEAAHVTEAQVRAAVETWVRYVTADARPDAVVERMEPFQVDGETVAYVAHLKGGGFVLAGADDLVLPVYLYSPRGTYDAKNMEYAFILQEINTRQKGLQKALADKDPRLAPYRAALAERAATWQTLISRRVPLTTRAPGAIAATPTILTLPMTSLWHQGSPYNDQTVELTPFADEHTLIGCNATATAQIMYFWKWPSTGTGSHSVAYDIRYRNTWDQEPLASNPGIPAGWAGRLEYDGVNHWLRMNGYWDATVYTSAQGISGSAAYQTALSNLWSRMTQQTKNPSANFGSATYNWSIMQDNHTDPPDASDIEVAKLNNHVAIGVDTSFGLYSSGSYFGNDVAGLKNYFRYDSDAAFGAAASSDSIMEEIQWGRLAGLGGSNAAGGGHAWVIYGYNDGVFPRQFLMNFGWGGSSDGWYTFDNVQFPLNHDMMTWIAPQNVKFVATGGSGDGSPSSPYGSVVAAIGAAPDWSTLIFKASSVNTFAGSSLVINRPLTLEGYGALITK